MYSLFQADNQSGKGVCVAASSHLLVEIAEQFDEGADNDDDWTIKKNGAKNKKQRMPCSVNLNKNQSIIDVDMPRKAINIDQSLRKSEADWNGNTAESLTINQSINDRDLAQGL